MCFPLLISFLKSGVFSDVESNHVGGYTISMPYHGPAEGPQDLRPSFREKHFFYYFVLEIPFVFGVFFLTDFLLKRLCI